MGVAVSAEQLAIGTNTQVWFLVQPPRSLRRLPAASVTIRVISRAGRILPERFMATRWNGPVTAFWVVNTPFSCLCTIGAGHNFIPRWKPRFVSALAAEDRCHLNGLAMENGRPRYITCLGETDTLRGWRKTRRQAAASSICPPGKCCFGDYRCPILPAFTGVTSGSWNQVADA